ncbi:MAG TPA: hypothetical protein VFX06_12500 [Stellaceae bacterium]|nr:hypothetical protein [Stellaceae bacterium]
MAAQWATERKTKQAASGWAGGRFALRSPPESFTVLNFAARMGQHAVIYSGVLAGAIIGCLLVYAPLETAMLGVACVIAGGLVILLLSSRRSRLRRFLQEAMVASYVAAAGALFKVIAELVHRL